MTYDVIVIGAGIMGVSSAHALAEEGKRVLVIDRLPLRNRQNASNDVSRIFRTYQMNDPIKERLAAFSREAWEALSERYPQRGVFRPCGVLVLGAPSQETRSEDIAWLDASGLRYQFPVFRGSSAAYDRSGAILNASAALSAYAKAAKSLGAVFLHGRSARDIAHGSVTLEDGTVFSADQVVVATGAWSDRLIGDRVKLRATRQDVAFFRPERLRAYRPDRFPVFAHIPTWFYGFPDHGVQAVKVARHALGPEIDPDRPTSDASPEFVAECRDFFRDVIPDLADAELIRSGTCRYAVRDGEDFLIDRLDDRTVVATAFRGEGFKFAPAVGHMVADLVLGEGGHHDFMRFRL